MLNYTPRTQHFPLDLARNPLLDFEVGKYYSNYDAIFLTKGSIFDNKRFHTFNPPLTSLRTHNFLCLVVINC